ncbi:MAG: Nif11-like leader peptide family RiPP precursor [Synergistaceae bacterium]|jgi:predicted ribosomally synthesized peptide with nif11-like leader|nr:Nif11-like leader peptide family RiPP precursor [Synergistaceae bacterium]
MSVAAAKKFLDKAMNDKEFAEKINSATREEWAALAMTIGEDFTGEEVRVAIAASVALDDDDLDKIAGGNTFADFVERSPKILPPGLGTVLDKLRP